MNAQRLTDEAYWAALDEASTAKDVLRAATAGAGWENHRRPGDGATPWMAVLEKGVQSETMPMLCKRMFEKGVDFTAEDRFGRTFWAWALHYGIEAPDGPSKVSIPVEILYLPEATPMEESGEEAIPAIYVSKDYTWLEMLRQKMPDMRNRAGEGVLIQMVSQHPDQASWSMAPAHCLQELRDRVPVEFSFSTVEWLAGTPSRQAHAGQLLFETSLSCFLRPIPNTTNTVRTRSSRGLTETLGAFPIVESTLKGVDPFLTVAVRLASLASTWHENDPTDSKYEALRVGLMQHAPVAWWDSNALKDMLGGGFAKSRGWTAWVDSMAAAKRARVLNESLPDPSAKAAKLRF